MKSLSALNPTKYLLLVIALALNACTSSPSLQGDWSVDVDATVNRANAAGVPESEAPHIQKIYAGGVLEITSNTLIIRIAGFSDVVTRRYRLVGKEGNCSRLVISGAPGIHNYCLERGKLVIQDPSAKIALIYSEE